MDELASLRREKGLRVLAVGLMSLLMVVLLVQALSAQESLPVGADLSGSSKSVNRDSASPGARLRYTIVLSNSGDQLASNVVMTDALPAELSYAGTLTVLGGGLWGENNGVITWTGGVNVDSQVEISFDALVSDSLTAGDLVTNTAVITGSGELLLRNAVTEIVSETLTYMPVFRKDLPPPTLLAIPFPTTSNQWTVSWTWNRDDVPDYELQESQSADFASAVTYDMGTSTSKLIDHSGTFNHEYYYRVRVSAGGATSGWSAPRSLIGYFDPFSSSSSGWAIRRQDTDDTDNDSWYQDGMFVLEVGGRWDYALASPLAPAPALPYRIKTNVWLHEPDNLNSYGIIFGGDWDGRTCPNADYSSCFNHYYRLNVIWHGAPDSYWVQLKRIDYHTEDTNAGKGVTLWGYEDVEVGEGHDPDGWNEWTIDVRADGYIAVYVNGNFVFAVRDDTYVKNPYFGVFASADEYCCARPFFGSYSIEPLE